MKPLFFMYKYIKCKYFIYIRSKQVLAFYMHELPILLYLKKYFNFNFSLNIKIFHFPTFKN